MPTISWNDTNKTWTFSGFSSYPDNSDWEAGVYDFWGLAIKKRLVGYSVWQNYIDFTSGPENGDFTTASVPAFSPQGGYEYQGYRVHVTGNEGAGYSYSFEEPTPVYVPTLGLTAADVLLKSVDALAETTVIATAVVGGAVIPPVSGKADSVGEATVSIILGTPAGYYLTGTVRMNGTITPNIKIIAVKTDGTKVFSNLSNADGTFSVSVEQGIFQVLGVYTDGSGNKYSSTITPYVQVI